jgi:tetratricopeptide (TPR) repeat protein
LQLQIGNALFLTEGFTSQRANESYARARDLAVALDRPDEHVQACGGLTAKLNAAARFNEAVGLLETFGPAELERMKPMARVSRLIRMGYPRMLRGELAEAGRILAEARREIENVRPEDWQSVAAVDPPIAVLTILTQNLTYQGLLSSAEACACEGLAFAERRQRAPNLVWALYNTGMMSALKGDWTDSITCFTRALELADRYGEKARGALAKWGLGRALVATGQIGDGTRLLREGYSGWTRFGGRMFRTLYAADAAEVLLGAGRTDAAAEFLLAGEKTLEETEEKYQAAALLSLRGRLVELGGDAAGAEMAYRQAIETAEQQGALLYSLKAATTLARLYQSQGRTDEANDALRPIYERFTEGFDYPDLVRARAMLESG